MLETIHNLTSGASYVWKVKLGDFKTFSNEESFTFSVIKAPEGFKIFEKEGKVRFSWTKPDLLKKFNDFVSI